VFLGWYEKLAQSCGARLLINDPEGTLRWQQSAFVQTYGLSDRAGWMRRVVEWAGQASQLWFKLWRAARYPSLRRRVTAMQSAAASSAALAFRDCSALRPQRFYVNAGLGILEAAHATVGMKRGEDHEYVLPPTVETHITSLPADLEQWLDRQPGSVAYICFGTMVAPSGNMVAELLDGLLSAGVSVLWSLPASQHSLLAGQPASERVRIETFVPQRAVLASRKIGCFITHGGAGGSQEAVVFGKPVLCIPFMWDQPYNCSVLARLGMGRVLSKRGIRSRRITAEIRELLGNPSYEESARRLAQEVRELQRTLPHSHDLRQLLISRSLPLETKAAV
jgi:hypothetical protein